MRKHAWCSHCPIPFSRFRSVVRPALRVGFFRCWGQNVSGTGLPARQCFCESNNTRHWQGQWHPTPAVNCDEAVISFAFPWKTKPALCEVREACELVESQVTGTDRAGRPVPRSLCAIRPASSSVLRFCVTIAATDESLLSFPDHGVPWRRGSSGPCFARRIA